MPKPKYPNILCLSTGGPTYEIEAGGKKWLFEWHPYHGPSALNRNTRGPLVRQPAEKSAFWDAVMWWDRQGKRVADGLCVWNREHVASYALDHVAAACYRTRLKLGARCDL